MQEVCLLYKNIFENDQYGFEPVIESVNDSNGFQPFVYWLRTFVQLISFAEYFNDYLNQ